MERLYVHLQSYVGPAYKYVLGILISKLTLRLSPPFHCPLTQLSSNSALVRSPPVPNPLLSRGLALYPHWPLALTLPHPPLAVPLLPPRGIQSVPPSMLDVDSGQENIDP